MSSRVLIYVLIAAVWIAFIAGVMIVQEREQRRLQEPRVDEPGQQEPGPGQDPGVEAAAA